MDGNLIQGIIMVVLLVMSAFFSATETSFSALNRTRLKNMAEKGNKRAEAALKLAENYDSLLKVVSDPEFRQATSGAHGSAGRADGLL